MVFARLVTDYLNHGCFLAEAQILARYETPGRHPGNDDPRPR
jgi:hypothetical protein